MVELFGMRKGYVVNNDFVTVKILHPDTLEPIGAEIDLATMDSDIFRKCVLKASRSIRREVSKKEADLTNANFYQDITVNVRNISYKGVQMTKETMLELYLDPDLKWLLQQLNEAIV